MPADFSLLPQPPPPVPAYTPLPVASAGPGPALPPAADPGSDGSLPVVDFAGIWQAVKRRCWVPVLTGALLTGTVGFWMLKSPRFYTSVAVVAVN